MLRYLRNRHSTAPSSSRPQGRQPRRPPRRHRPALRTSSADRGPALTRSPYVDTGNVAGGRMATEVLIERGCTRIGTIAGPADMTAGQDRLQGWKSAMREGGLADKAVEHGDFTEAGGGLAARALLERHPRLDGIFVASDLMASGTLRVLAAAGRRVPDDVAVVGYDDLGVAERTTPPLTTVVQPIVEMAEQATRLLLQQVDGDRAARAMR